MVHYPKIIQSCFFGDDIFPTAIFFPDNTIQHIGITTLNTFAVYWSSTVIIEFLIPSVKPENHIWSIFFRWAVVFGLICVNTTAFFTEFYALVNSNDSVFLEFIETNIFSIVIFISFYRATLKKQLSLSKLLIFSVTLPVSFFLFTGISLDKTQPTPEYTQSLRESSQIDPYSVAFFYTEKPLVHKKFIVDLNAKGSTRDQLLVIWENRK